MNRLATVIYAILTFAFTANCANPTSHSFAYADTVRTYQMFIPDSLQPDRPLIICTHGYGSKTRMYEGLNEAAARHGYAMCYPDGAPDSRGKKGWNVGYPSQRSMTTDEADFMKALIQEVCAKFDLNSDEVFLTGMSNGGDLCYQMAYTHPELFKAYASVAGLTFTWMYNSHRLSTPTPFMEIHGTADRTSMWDGDPTNSGGWGEYLPVPFAVAAIAYNNRCSSLTSEPVETLPDSKRQAIRHTYSGSPSNADAELIEINGGKHSWASKDIPTAEIICDFFNRCRGK